jgi:transposase/DNA-binding phage protein
MDEHERVERERLRRVFAALEPVLDERTWRLVAAAEARALGHGGMTVVAQVSGLARSTLGRGVVELGALDATDMVGVVGVETAVGAGRVRRPGGGRKSLVAHDATLLADLETLVDPVTRGDPESPLRWTSKSRSKLALALRAQGHRVSGRTVGRLLRGLGYSLQAPRKTLEGTDHPDRDAQFEHINAQAQAFQERGQPVISVDAKKKELVGLFKNGGREWQPVGQPERVNVHDFPSQAEGRALPYGVYDLAQNTGWVSVGTDHDTATFAVETIRRWWQQMGTPTYPGATDLLITADGGGSNSSRSRLWKVALQQLADDTGLRVQVCHFPPGTSKWNKIEHRLFAHITENWRGRPLVSQAVVVNLIGSTTTTTGLAVRAALDPAHYPTKQKVSDAELNRVQLQRADFHGEWNYAIHPVSRTN